MTTRKASELPEITSERLSLRPFTLDDAADVQRLAGDFAIADTTLTIPHPYEDGIAEEWIGAHAGEFERSEGVTLAITLRRTGELVGAISLLDVDHRSQRAELGYWVGKPYWNQGYATEAARAMIAYGFDELGLNRIFAHHLARNAASGRVLQKAGMVYEGVLRQHLKRWQAYEDVTLYGLLRDERLETER